MPYRSRPLIWSLTCLLLLGSWWGASAVNGAELANTASRVLPAGQLPDDARLKPLRLLRDKEHPWNPPQTKEAWEKEAQLVREQILVSTGLWPMPEKAPLKPVIHGKIDRGTYTIEKVYFQSLPGHYVTGNLYRPKKIDGKAPGILSPHGHWRDGRFHQATEKEIADQFKLKAEEFESGAKHPVQARHHRLAKMGCIAFHYDMVGYADSKPIPHGNGFADVDGELWLQNAMGLQTFNSLCALDFLMSLPDVDKDRIGVTGQSGGGTQTFILCAIDPRPVANFPACMISTNMQGGCTCENCSYLRLGLNNVTIASLFAPKPMAMNAAHDWTIDIETKGLPEMKQIYGLYGKPENVAAKCFPQFGHNYNQPARELMYNWFNKHLHLNQPEPVKEEPFEPVPPKELSVWDAEHPLPADALVAPALRANLKKKTQEHLAALLPKDEAGVKKYKQEVGPAARVLLGGGYLTPEQISKKKYDQKINEDGTLILKVGCRPNATHEEIPTTLITKIGSFNGKVLLLVDGRGKEHFYGADGKLLPAFQKLLDGGYGLVLCDVFQTGEFLKDGKPAEPQVNKDFAGYTYGYNRPWVAERVRDIRAVVTSAAELEQINSIHLVGTHGAGVWAALAATEPHEKVKSVTVDWEGFGFGRVTSTKDPQLLPGALKYGGLGGLAALAAPTSLEVFGTEGIPAEELTPLKAVYDVAAKDQLVLHGASPKSDEELVQALLKK
ncbi:MAG: alpha/beta hydrolase family protein [Planctomycetales bacterium]